MLESFLITVAWSQSSFDSSKQLFSVLVYVFLWLTQCYYVCCLLGRQSHSPVCWRLTNRSLLTVVCTVLGLCLKQSFFL